MENKLVKSVDLLVNVYYIKSIEAINEASMRLNEAVIYYYELIGITEYKLAIVSGIDRGALHRMLKNDEWNPEAYTLERIAKALSVNHSDIIIKKESLVAGYRKKDADEAFIKYVGEIKQQQELSK